MSIIEQHFEFVKEQIAFQTKMAAKFASNEWRRDLHLASCEKFKLLLKDMEDASRLLDEAPLGRPQARTNLLALKPEDLDGLPPELLAELSDAAAVDKGEALLLQIIDEAGGVASLDQILVAIYKRTHEVLKRSTLTSKLYRLAQRGSIFNIPNKKGVYATYRMTEEQAAKLFGQDIAEPSQSSLV